MFEQWNMWSECSLTCDGGIRRRTRVCVNGFVNQLGCNGPVENVEDCNINVRNLTLLDQFVLLLLFFSLGLLYLALWENIVILNFRTLLHC